jgi:hypothetical protein
LPEEETESRIREYEETISKLDKRLADGQISEKTHKKVVKRFERLIEEERKKEDTEKKAVEESVEEETVEEEKPDEDEVEVSEIEKEQKEEEEESVEEELDKKVVEKQGDYSLLPLDDEIKVVSIFVMIGLGVGIVNGLVGLGGRQGAILALVFFVVSFKLPQVLMDPLSSSFDFSVLNILKAGGIPYWFLMLVVWTLTYNLSL